MILDPKIIGYLQSRSKEKSSDNNNSVQQSPDTIDDVCENDINDDARMEEPVENKTEDTVMKSEDTAGTDNFKTF